jgi:hypothetical protein
MYQTAAIASSVALLLSGGVSASLYGESNLNHSCVLSEWTNLAIRFH